jgi:hypothetical protein
MVLKRTFQQFILCLAVSASPLVLAQGAGTPNASSSSGAANADTMAPGATGAGVPKGAGDTSASGASSAGSTKSMKKLTKKKSRAKTSSGMNAAPAPAQ